MKISNIIITAYVVLVIGSLLVLFVDSKYHKENEHTNTEMKTYPLGNFSVVVAEQGSDVHLDQADSLKIEVEYIKNQPAPNQLYKLSNDTLYVFGGLRTFVKCKHVKSIISHKTYWLGVSNFSADSLQLDINGGHVYFSGEGDKNIEIKKLIVNASDTADIETYNLTSEKLVLKASSKCYLRFYGNYKSADVDIKEQTELQITKNIMSLNLVKDDKSNINVY